MADRVGYAGDPETNETDPKMADGSLVRSKDEWGSIIDILHGIENTTQPSKPAQSVSSPTSRLATLSENIESTKMAAATDAKKGQGLQQLDHLVRMMEQMCQIQKQSSKLREQAEYLSAIKDLQELKNESLMQTCKCDAHQRSSDMYRMPDETFSEPESTVGDEMDSRRDVSPPREKRVSRSVKREPKAKGAKKRSRSLDPYRKDTTEPGEKDAEKDRERERGRPGIFSKFERMKEKLTTRRGSVKKHNIGKRLDDKQDEETKANLYMPDIPSNDHFGLQINGTETKSEDSGIFHVGLEDIINSTRLASEVLPKSLEDLSDNEDVFTSVQPPWNQVDNFSMEVRKGSDLSTGSSSEDYLDLKSKRTTVHLPKDYEPVVLRNPERQQQSEDQDEKTVKSGDEKNVRRKMRVRRSASLQDTTSLNSDDDDDNEDYDNPSKAWEVKEAPAIMQRDKTGHKLLQKTRSNDMDFSDASLDMQTGQDSASTSSIESKAAQKRKYFRKSHHVEEPISPTTDQRIKALATEMKSPKSSPPEKKGHKVGWEKVKHAVTRKHIGEIGKIKPGTVSMDESLLRSSEEPSSPTDSSLLEDMFAGGRGKGAESRKGDVKQEKERGGPAVMSSPETQSPSTIYESLQANLTEDFAKKMEKWDKKKQKHGTTGLSPLEKAKQSSVESCSSEAGNLPSSDLEAELQRGLTEDFYKKLAEWDKLKQHQKGGGMGPNSPKIEPKQKQKGFIKEAKKATKSGKGNNKEKEKDKSKMKENTQQQSKSPELSVSRKISPPSEAIYTTDNITVFAKQGGKLKLEGASKEFSKKYKEWEKKEKKKKNYPPIKAEDISSPVFEHAQALPRDDVITPPSPTSPTMNESSDHDPSDLFIIVHATPVIVEPEFDVDGEAGHGTARAGEPVFRTQSAPPSSTAFLQGDSPNTQRAASTEEDVFTPGTSSSPPVPQEKMNRLEQRNSFLAEQLKLDDVNLLAVQEEIVNMEEQLSEISGEKPEVCVTERRVSTCSSIGESALEAELCDIKMQIAQLEENLKKRPRHKGHQGVKGQGQVTSAASGTADLQPNTLSSKETQEKTTAESTATSRETLIQNDVTQKLEKSLHEREAIIKLLQARVERQAQEINYLKNGSDLASQFRRAKSFTARDKKTFDPRSMKVIDITLTEKEKCRILLDDRSESSRSLQTDSTPSLDTLHISAEDIRLDESNQEQSFKEKSIVEKNSTEIQTDDSQRTLDNKASITQEVLSTEKPAQSEHSERTREGYPGLYGPIETKLKRRRTRSTDRPLPSSEQEPSNAERRETDVETALDSLSAKIVNETKVQDATMMREKDDEEKGPLSPTAGAKKVMPKLEVVKLADGLKSQTVELSPRSQRRRERQNQDVKVDEVSLKESTSRSSRKSSESTESKSKVRNRTSEIDFKQGRAERSRPRERTDDSETSQKDHVKKEDLTARSETENNSRRVGPWEEELNLVAKKTSMAVKAEDKQHSTSSQRQIRSTMEASSERQRGRKTQMTRTLSSDTEPPGRPSEKERRSSVENLRAAIERRQRSFSSETTDSDQESQSNATKALELRLGSRINMDRKDPSESLGKQSIRDRREPVLMRSNQKDNSSVSGLRRKFVTQDFNSTPNIPDIGVRTGRKEKERPKEGCVKQMSQAFTSGSVIQQGANDVRRRSRSSSTRSSPQSLSPASSNSSLNNIVASQIKRLQDKASSSPESPERRTSIQMKTLKDSIPSLYSLQGRVEHRQSLTNIADVRAKFDKKPDSPATSDSSPMPSRTSSPSDARRTARKEPRKPTLVPSVAAARIKYTVSVTNSEKSEPQKKSVRKNGNATTPHVVAVTESPQSEKSKNKDSTVTFTINQKQKRRQNASQGPARLEENNNNSNNNDRNYQNRDACKKASSSGATEAKEQSRQTNQKESKDSEDHEMTRKNSFSRNDKRRGSLPRQRESSNSSRRGSLTRGKESPKEPARRKSFSKGKESPQSGSRRNSLTKARDSSNESNKGKTISKDSEPTQETSSLNVLGTNQNDEERSRRRRRRRERNAPSPEPPRANAQVEINKSEADFNSKMGENNPGKSETNKTSTKPGVDANQSSKSMSKQGTIDDLSLMRLHNQSKAEPEFKTGSKQEAKSEAKLDTKLDTKAEVKHETKPEVRTATKSSEVKREVKPKVKTDAKSEARPEAKPVAKQDVNFEVKSDAKSQQKHDAKSNLKPEAKHDAPEAKSERGPERRNRREERTRRQREKEEEVNKEKEAAAKLKAEAARAKLKEEIEAARLREKDAKLKAEKESEEAKKVNRVKRRESKRAERKELKKTVEKGDPKKEAVVSEVSPNAQETSVHDVKRQSKKEEQKPSRVTQDIPSKTSTSQDAKKTKDGESANMPDLVAQTQKTSGESCVGEDALGGRSARAILTNSALRGAEAAIGHPLPKSSTPEEDAQDDATDDRRSRKDATRRSRAINRGSRITKLDIFKRARSVDSSKASKDRSPDRLLGGGGASSRSCSMDRSGKNRDKSPGGEETRKGGSWLSKRTGSISNFLRPSNHNLELWEDLNECYSILQSCSRIDRPVYEYEDLWQLRFVRETSILC